MSHYLVTGAAGFIASQVAELLLAAGHTVVGLDNLNDAYDVRLKEWRLARLLDRPGFEFRRQDLTDLAALREVFRPAQPFAAVINLAARAGVRQSVESPWVYIDTNVTGTLNLLELCREYGVGKFVLASTSSLYGENNQMPYSEEGNTDRPLSPYAASKKGAEALCHTYHSLYGLDVTILRYFTVYGPAGRPDMSLFRFVQWIREDRPVIVLGDGEQSRDFTYIDDIARGTVAGLKPLGYEIINLGSDEPVKLISMIRLIERRLARQSRLEFRPRQQADVMATWADISKAKVRLDWSPAVTYEAGVNQLIDWYEANRSWAREIATD